MTKWKKTDFIGNEFEESEDGNITNVNGEDEHKFSYSKDFLGNEIRQNIETGEKEYKVELAGNEGWEEM